jgi:hypothetical protein
MKIVTKTNTVVGKVKDERRRSILTSDYVTQAIEKSYKTRVVPNVSYEGKPYLFPEELCTRMQVSQFSDDLMQRDTIISVPAGEDGKPKVVLFARSWINKRRLSPQGLKKLYEHRLTIGKIVRECEGRCHSKQLWYRERKDEKLGAIFGTDGADHFVQRGRVISLNGQPAIFIEEFVQV